MENIHHCRRKQFVGMYCLNEWSRELLSGTVRGIYLSNNVYISQASPFIHEELQLINERTHTAYIPYFFSMCYEYYQ